MSLVLFAEARDWKFKHVGEIQVFFISGYFIILVISHSFSSLIYLVYY